jgi:hypothetical protein
LGLDEDGPAGAEPAQRIVEAMATAASSAGVAESRSGPRNFAVRWKLPSLFSTTPSATSAAQGR